MTTPESKVQIITADQVPDLLEQILALRNPELHATRRANRKKTREQLRRWDARTAAGKPHLVAVHESGLSIVSNDRPTPAPRGSFIIRDPKVEIGGAAVTDLNRNLNSNRVAKYVKAMLRGEWILTPDAIAITAEGLIINGQHRLAAAHYLVTKQPTFAPMPSFIVAWGIAKNAALFMDEAARTTTDRRAIALRHASLTTQVTSE